MDSSNDSLIIAFKAIHSFITAMNEEFGEKNKPLRLYTRLIEQTTFSHTTAIQKHVQAFTKFCIENREAIYDKKIDCISFPRIKYSDRVFINIRDIFKLANTEEKNIMWQHILTISALLDTTGKAKQVLKDTLNAKDTNDTETNFLTGLIDKIEQNVDVNSSNPMEAVGQIMSSGIFTELISSMNDQVNTGKLDMSKMMGVVQNMVGTLSKDQPEIGQMVNGLMSTFNLNSLDDLANPNATPPDLSNLSNLLGNLGNLGLNPSADPNSTPPNLGNLGDLSKTDENKKNDL